MICIRTGADVYFNSYETTVRADIYEVGDTYVIRWNGQSTQYAFDKADADLVVECVTLDDYWFYREDISIAVVPRELCLRYF